LYRLTAPFQYFTRDRSADLPPSRLSELFLIPFRRVWLSTAGPDEIIPNLPQKRRGGPEEGMTRSGPSVDGYYRNFAAGGADFERPNTKGLRHSYLFRIVLLFLAAVIGYYMVSGKGELERSESSGVTSPDIVANLEGLDGEKGLQRLSDYCPVSISHGSEGTLSASELEFDMTLKYILINIRHGDRSAIHLMPGSAPLSLDIIDKGPHLEPNALNYRVQMKCIRLEKIAATTTGADTAAADTDGRSSKESHTGAAAAAAAGSVEPDSLSHSKLFSVSDYRLEQGQLTTRGFMQHITLGTLLKRSYSSFLSSHIKSSANVYVRSTKYDRTFQSAAALLTALVPHLLTPDKRVRYTRLQHLLLCCARLSK
jgi:Histidine phosphatase superfamily (branch 2)